MFILYSAPQSTCSQKVRLCMAEKNLKFEERKLDLFKGDQLTPEYKAINPNGVVPSLLHDKTPVIDSSVIIEYLDESFPEVSLSPQDPPGRAIMRTWLRFFEEVPTPAVRVPSYNRVFLRLFQNMTDEEFIAFGESKPLRKDFFLKMGRKGYPQEELDQALGRFRLTVERMEADLSEDAPWLMGEQYTLADICVFPSYVRMDDIGYGYLWQDAPKVTEWFKQNQARPNYEKAFYHSSLLSEQYPDLDLKSI